MMNEQCYCTLLYDNERRGRRGEESSAFSMAGVLLVRDYWLVIFVPWNEPNAERRSKDGFSSGDWGVE